MDHIRHQHRFATSGLFFNPSVVSLIPSLVPRNRLVQANSLYNFTMTGSQLVGIVFIAPILLKSGGEDAMFLAGAVLFVLAAAFALGLRSVREEHQPRLPQGPLFGAFRINSGRAGARSYQTEFLSWP